MNNNTVKRLAIFIIYDKDGIIDGYIPYYLNEIRKNVKRLVIVCNGKLTDEGRVKLTAFTDGVFVRPNIGFDCGAVEDALFNYIGWNEVYKYDELLIANDSVYGPFCPLKQVFEKMDNCEVDFWGMTLQAESYDYKYSKDRRIIPAHVQSYFVNIKSRLLHGKPYYDFWNELDTSLFTFEDAIHKYEIGFSVKFLQMSYSYGAYVDTSRYFTSDIKENFDATDNAPLDLIKFCGAPFIKRKSLICKMAVKLKYRVDEKPNEIMRYIDEKTDYDVNLIWDNLLRTTPAQEITEHLNIRFLLSNIDDAAINSLFEENPRLGVLYEPQPYHCEHFETFIKKTKNSDRTWHRDEAIKDADDFKNSDLPEIARQNGYYTGIVQTVDAAAVRCRDLEYMFVKLCELLPQTESFFDLLNTVRLRNIREFCDKHSTIYIYGAGGEAKFWAETMRREGISFEGFVVSDGQPKKDEFLGKKIVFVSEINTKTNDCGLVLALNKNNTQAVLKVSEIVGFGNVLKAY